MRPSLQVLAPCALLLALLVFCGPRAYAALLGNVARVDLLKAAGCPPGRFSCPEDSQVYPPLGWGGNRERLERAAQRLYASIRWSGSSGVQRAATDLAAALFALGRRAAAAEALALAGPSGNVSPLYREGRYEADLLRGRQAASARAWADAVDLTRLGLARGAERTLPSDEHDLFLALAELHRLRATSGQEPVRSTSLAGKYLVLAGRWPDGATVLRQALDKQADEVGAGSGGPPVSNRDLGRAWLSLGLALQHTGDSQGARQAYSTAIEQDPPMSEAAARLLSLDRLQRDDTVARQAEGKLLAWGPRYRIGEGQSQVPGVQADAMLGGGWSLFGYDLDEEALESGAPVDLLLWWQNSRPEVPCGEGWLKVGDFWLKWQRVTNLAPNAGFEWGIGEEGLPKGYEREYYGSAPGSLAVKPAERGDQTTMVMVQENTVSRRTGLVGPTVPVDDAALYLGAAWMWDDGGGRIGRLCHGPDQGGPYYLPNQGGKAQGVWVHYADLNRALPGRSVHECEVFLTNYDSGGTVLWDDVLLARIEAPAACGNR